jgi:excinuclease UvrABC nuclease subunit
MDDVIRQYKERLSQLFEKPKFPFNDELRNKLPKSGGVYHVLDRGSYLPKTIYVGKTTRLRARISGDHLTGNRDGSTFRNKLIVRKRCTDENSVTEYLLDNCLVQYLEIENKVERNFFEHFLIAYLRPIYND